jgi:putative FmdB family regulatory protein
MPIYEYACGKCNAEFEVEQRITENPVKTCPKCRSRKVKRLISQTSFHLKGGGWHSDLYASTGGKDKSADDASESASDSKTDSKSDSKPEKKSSGDQKKSKKKGAKAAA